MHRFYCNEINNTHVEQQIRLCGWIQSSRNHGKFYFLELRDRTGIMQIVVDEDCPQFEQIQSVKKESCIQVIGKVNSRVAKKAGVETNSYEVYAQNIVLFNESNSLPLDFNVENSEELRFKYRYLDLRQQKIQHNLIKRAKITSFVRSFLESNHFLDLETPILCKATPEGARDYLVPSRIYPGNVYALPQSPQLFKQIFMIAGFDRYYQIVRCFRDEDLRADRQPEFTQIDIETSFLTAQEVQNITEQMIRELWQSQLNIDLGQFPVMTYEEALFLYGCDKPDLRNPLQFVELKSIFKDTNFNAFKATANSDDSRIVALCVPQADKFSRKVIDNLTDDVKKLGAKGLAWLKIKEDKIDSPIAKFLTEEELNAIQTKTNAKVGDVIFIVSDQESIVNQSMDMLRQKLGADLELYDKNSFKALWVVDFPMFEKNDDRFVAMHHPFTAPKDMSPEQLQATPEKAVANAYDMVINGYEVGGGSVRIYNEKMQRTVFDLIGLSANEQEEKFGFLLDALKYGTPPHAGFAFGLDRLVMLATHSKNIKEVIAFPKTLNAFCPLTQAPAPVDKASYDELNLQLKPNEK